MDTSSKQVLKCDYQQFMSLYPNLSSYGNPNYEDLILHIKDGLSYPQAGPKTSAAPINDKISRAFDEAVLKFFEVNCDHIATLPNPIVFMLKFRPIFEENRELKSRFNKITEQFKLTITIHHMDEHYAEISTKIPLNELLAANTTYSTLPTFRIGGYKCHFTIGKRSPEKYKQFPFVISLNISQKVNFNSLFQIGTNCYTVQGDNNKKLKKGKGRIQSDQTYIFYDGKSLSYLVRLNEKEIQSQKDSNNYLPVTVKVTLFPLKKSPGNEKHPSVESKANDDDDVIIDSNGSSSESNDDDL